LSRDIALKPQVESEYVQQMPFLPCYCPSCGQEVPYMNYCGNCGQKFESLLTESSIGNEDYY
jgi:predicted amidophosphoribosyltransferase